MAQTTIPLEPRANFVVRRDAADDDFVILVPICALDRGEGDHEAHLMVDLVCHQIERTVHICGTCLGDVAAQQPSVDCAHCTAEGLEAEPWFASVRLIAPDDYPTQEQMEAMAKTGDRADDFERREA